MSYEEAMAFWFGQVNFEQRLPKPDDLSLDRIRTLLRRLGNPERRLRIIHVAGSKGKGSTSAMLASILRHAGYRTGLFTSPHLCRVEERMEVDGQPATTEELAALLSEVKAAVESTPVGIEPRTVNLDPTFFEIATALGFLHFLRLRVDVAVIEVGLGGRFDSTNVCIPEVALITSISFDHTKQLGNRLASIAMEKAGIVKPGRPTVSGATVHEAREVIEQICRERRSPLRQLGFDFRYAYEPGRVKTAKGHWQMTRVGPAKGPGTLLPSERPRVRITTEHRTWPIMELGLLGEHQAANAAVAVACIENLRAAGWHLPDGAVAAGLADVFWPARMEVLGRRPLVVLDCAHNVASAQALVNTLAGSFPPGRRLLVFASSNDKDVSGIFRTLAPHFAHAFLTRYGDSPRSIPPQDLVQLLRRCAALPCTVCPSAAEAWHAARSAAGPDDLVCVTGSVFLAGELRPLLVEASRREAGLSAEVSECL
jgi:dihydrofolate synthase/folylpolyglutamate synthase